jgi:hypothetical protein
MIPILAKTEWPTLGEIVWQYLTTDEAIIYTPGLSMFAIVIFCVITEWLLAQHLSPLIPDERLLVTIMRTNAILKMPAAFFLIKAYEKGNNLVPSPQLLLILAVLVITESIVYCKTGGIPFTLQMLMFICLSTGIAAIGFWLVFSYGFCCISFLVVGVIGLIYLIAQDKLAAAECSWIIICLFFE